MAKNVEFELNLPGLNELMKSSEMQSALKAAGESIVANTGGDYDTATYVLNFVAVQNVWPATREAAIDNYRNNTLVKATGASGLPMK